MSRWVDRLDVLSAAAVQDPEGFLGHPVNAFKLMKRLNTEWTELESLVLSDMSDGTSGPDSSQLPLKQKKKKKCDADGTWLWFMAAFT